MLGSLLGATLVPGAVGTRIGNSLFGSIETQLQIITPLVLLLMLRREPNGFAKQMIKDLGTVRRLVRGRVEPDRTPTPSTGCQRTSFFLKLDPYFHTIRYSIPKS